jgi:hypothetical protein
MYNEKLAVTFAATTTHAGEEGNKGVTIACEYPHSDPEFFSDLGLGAKRTEALLPFLKGDMPTHTKIQLEVAERQGIILHIPDLKLSVGCVITKLFTTGLLESGIWETDFSIKVPVVTETQLGKIHYQRGELVYIQLQVAQGEIFGKPDVIPIDVAAKRKAAQEAKGTPELSLDEQKKYALPADGHFPALNRKRGSKASKRKGKK